MFGANSKKSALRSGGYPLPPGRLAIFCLSLAVIATSVAMALAQSEQRNTAERPITLDVPAQPLAAALEKFSSASGYQILVADASAQSLRSSAIKGMFFPREALYQIIAGTGLEVRFTSAQAAVLMGKSPSQTGPTPLAQDGQERYDAMLQHDVVRALCRDDAIQPGRYRTALDLWVTPAGGIERIDLLSSTGSEDRDRRIVAALHALSVAPPPSNLARPITLLILPKGDAARSMCNGRYSNGAMSR